MPAEYRELLPHPALGQYVDRFWVRSALAPTLTHILPDGCMDVLIDAARPDDATTVGAMTRALRFAPRGPVHLVAVRFRPGAAAPFLSVSADELTDRAVDLDDLGRRWLDAGEIVSQSDLLTAARKLERALLARLESIATPDPAILHAVSALSRRSPPTIAELARAIGWSRQHLGRAFRRCVGVSPKEFARISRMQHAIDHLQWGQSASLADAALDAGYFDQAHMNREFRDLAGVTPRMAASSPGSIRPIRSIFAER